MELSVLDRMANSNALVSSWSSRGTLLGDAIAKYLTTSKDGGLLTVEKGVNPETSFTVLGGLKQTTA